MLPQEFEHTKEPAYNNDFRWLPGFRLQPFSTSTPSTKESKAIDGPSCRQNGGDMTGVGSPAHVPAIPEHELSRERPKAVGNETPMTISPKYSSNKWTTSEGQLADTLHAAPTEFSPPAVTKNPALLETLVEATPSGDCVTKNEIPISAEQLRSNGMNMFGELHTFQSKPLVVHCL